MRFYHGTNSNALAGIISSGFRLLSKDGLFQAGIPLFCGENASMDSHLVSLKYVTDLVWVGTDRKWASAYSGMGFDYKFNKDLLDRLETENFREEFKEEKDKRKAHLRLVLERFQDLSRIDMTRVLNPKPILLVLDCDNATDLGKVAQGKDHVGGVGIYDSIDLENYLIEVYTSNEGLPLAERFVKSMNKSDLRLEVDDKLVRRGKGYLEDITQIWQASTDKKNFYSLVELTNGAKT